MLRRRRILKGVLAGKSRRKDSVSGLVNTPFRVMTKSKKRIHIYFQRVTRKIYLKGRRSSIPLAEKW